MSFYQKHSEWKQFDFKQYLHDAGKREVENILNKSKINERDFLCLLSPIAGKYLEEMAEKAHRLTIRNFGKVMFLYAPIYVANYCDNQCVYCGFKNDNDVERRKLSLSEVEKEAKAVADRGIKHILLLTGGSRSYTPLSYIKECVQVLKKYFTSISIEIYALTEEEYREMIESGVDGLTLYQETYTEEIYKKLHPEGPKKNFKFRLEAPDRACRSGMRYVNIGSLLGLNDWRKEAFLTGIHANYLQNEYLSSCIGISVPRIQEYPGADYTPSCPVSDRELVQIMLAYRLFLPWIGLTVSTRESAELRRNLLPLGVTKLSADSSTAVGGYTDRKREGQFAVSDGSSVEEVKQMICKSGYQPVFKYWQLLDKAEVVDE